jgi:hypothetical protein
MNCEVCNQGPMHGTTVYRTGPKGQAPHWRCQFHLTTEQREAIPEEAAILCAVIEQAQQPGKEGA